MQNIRDVQTKILEIMKFIDEVCRKNNVVYYIMGGTALGAVRHGGFIPWDDDLDIFMTPKEYSRFKEQFNLLNNPKFFLQEWKSVEGYVEYVKVRMNGTTFIESNYRHRRDLHQGIFVDIMILHKTSKKRVLQWATYAASKFVALYGMSQRNWKPRTRIQALALLSLKFLPSRSLTKICYKLIYSWDNKESNFKYCYWITRAGFKGGLFDESFFWKSVDIPFEDVKLMGSDRIKDYLALRYGDYMKLPSSEERKRFVHAEVFDCERDYKEYFDEIDSQELSVVKV